MSYIEIKRMLSVPEIEYILNNILPPYEASIHNIESIFDTTGQILKDFQGSLDTKQARESTNAQVRENLVRNESLRRKDFDNMMQGILSIQDEREKEVRNLLNVTLMGRNRWRRR